MAAKAMRKAWEIVKEAMIRFGGKARQYMAEALRMAWAAVKKEGMAVIDRIEELEGKGFKRWTKGNLDRLYINASQLGLVCTYYKTGSISGAWFCGDRVSNGEGYRMKGSKTFIDIKTERVYSDNEALGQAAAALAGLTYTR